jgi:hypothetical protein
MANWSQCKATRYGPQAHTSGSRSTFHVHATETKEERGSPLGARLVIRCCRAIIGVQLCYSPWLLPPTASEPPIARVGGIVPGWGAAI